jgi:ankyrin repeat protein
MKILKRLLFIILMASFFYAHGQVLDSKLVNAVELNEVDRVKQLLKDGASANAADIHGNTAMQIAIREGYGDVAAQLILGGADIAILNNRMQNLLHIAVEKDKPVMVDALLKKGVRQEQRDYNGETPLQLAARLNRVACVKAFVDNKGETYYKDGESNIPLHVAARDGFTEVVELLIKGGAEIQNRNKHGETPLHLAAKNGHLETVKALLKGGADINDKTPTGKSVLQYADEGNTAGAEGAFEVSEYLKKKGAFEEGQEEAASDEKEKKKGKAKE